MGEGSYHLAGGLIILRVSNLVGNEVFVKREPVIPGDARQHFACFFGRSWINLFATLDQQRVGEIVKDGTAGSQVFDDIETQAGGFDGCSRCRDPARPPFKKCFAVSVSERDRINPASL